MTSPLYLEDDRAPRFVTSRERTQAGLPGEEITMPRSKIIFAVLVTFALNARADAPHAVVTDLMTKELTGIPNKEALTILVDYPPGAVDPVHRHDAHAFVYVLEGNIVMGLKGGKEVTLGPGQMFYEGPNDLHTVGRNASQTKPAKFIVTLIKNRNVPFFIPAH
jgi:quercetin dioxygenase-like cupin family protein